MTTSSDYKTAIQVQDACNLGGVLRAWEAIRDRIWEDVHEAGSGTLGFRYHPINVMFASKVSDLTACDHELSYHDAYTACAEKVEACQ